MPLYMTQFSYTCEAWVTLAKHPQDRSEAIIDLLRKLGGRLIALYYCLGEYDGVVIYEVPNDMAAETVLIAAVAPGHLKTTKTTKLLTVEETIEAMKIAGTLSFPGPSISS
jgi:uncharacterized protein with GYD domain